MPLLWCFYCIECCERKWDQFRAKLLIIKEIFAEKPPSPCSALRYCFQYTWNCSEKLGAEEVHTHILQTLKLYNNAPECYNSTKCPRSKVFWLNQALLFNFASLWKPAPSCRAFTVQWSYRLCEVAEWRWAMTRPSGDQKTLCMFQCQILHRHWIFFYCEVLTKPIM